VFTLPETITVWNEASNDGAGRKTWTRATYPARIAYTQKKFTDKNGDSAMSTAVCYSEGLLLTINSRVLFSSSTATEPTADANDVRALSQIPSGAGDLKKCWFS